MDLFKTTALSTAVLVSGCGHNDEPPKPHEDGNLYASDALFVQQRNMMQCAVPRSKIDFLSFPQPAAGQGYDGLRKYTFYFGFDEDKPLSPEESIQKLAQTYRDNKQIGFRIKGCTDKAGDAKYNFDLSRRRIESIARILQEEHIHPDRICKLPEGEGCEKPERKVEIETYDLDMESGDAGHDAKAAPAP